jgi:hypothetical protein
VVEQGTVTPERGTGPAQPLDLRRACRPVDRSVEAGGMRTQYSREAARQGCAACRRVHFRQTSVFLHVVPVLASWSYRFWFS